MDANYDYYDKLGAAGRPGKMNEVDVLTTDPAGAGRRAAHERMFTIPPAPPRPIPRRPCMPPVLAACPP
jgi:hypothetical protein